MARRAFFCLVIFVLCAGASQKDATEALLAAAADGDGDKIIAALQAGANPNARNAKKTPALVTVATQTLFGRDEKVIAAFVKAKADLNIADTDGATPLMASCATGRTKITELLIAAGAKLDRKDNDGWTAVHYAVTNNNWPDLQQLITAEADLNTLANDKYSALMMAIGGGKGTMAEKLLKFGATYPTSWPDKSSTLVHAVSGRDLQAVRVVLEHEAKIDEPDPEDGFTPLAIAAWNDDAQIVMELLRAGADPSIKDKKGNTPLDQAISQKNPEVAALLGGKWNKPRPEGGHTMSIPCPALGGNVESNLAVDGKTLVFTTTFPHPMTYYLGGGNTNRAKSAKQYTYEGSFTPAYYLDTDSNVKTGRKADMLEKDAAGADYTVDYDQYGTSVRLRYLNSKGEEREKQVYGNVVDVNVRKGDERMDVSELGDDIPRAENDNGVLRSRVPLSLLALKPGAAVRVTAKIGSCKAVTEKVTLR